MVRLAPEAFIGQLHKMYKNTKNSGSVCLSFKKYNGAPPKAKKAIASGQYEPCCIVRAVAKKKKISTFIKAEDVVKFQGQLTNVMKVKTKVKALSEELENPMNVHRWRKLFYKN